MAAPRVGLAQGVLETTFADLEDFQLLLPLHTRRSVADPPFDFPVK